MVLGSPAHVVRALTEEVARNRANAAHYVRMGRLCLNREQPYLNREQPSPNPFYVDERGLWAVDKAWCFSPERDLARRLSGPTVHPPVLLMHRATPFGWLAALGLACLASSALMRRLGRLALETPDPRYGCPDDLQQRCYA